MLYIRAKLKTNFLYYLQINANCIQFIHSILFKYMQKYTKIYNKKTVSTHTLRKVYIFIHNYFRQMNWRRKSEYAFAGNSILKTNNILLKYIILRMITNTQRVPTYVTS